MAGIGKFKLSDLVKPPQTRTSGTNLGVPSSIPGHNTNQSREAQESQRARNAQARTRDRMVDIGRGNQQAGRQK